MVGLGVGLSLAHEIRELTFAVLKDLCCKCLLLLLKFFDLSVVVVHLSQKLLLRETVLNGQYFLLFDDLLSRSILLHLESFDILHRIGRAWILQEENFYKAIYQIVLV